MISIPTIEAIFTVNKEYTTLEFQRAEVKPYENTVYVNITRINNILTEGAISCSEGSNPIPYEKFDLSLSHTHALQVEIERSLDNKGAFVLKLAAYQITIIHFEDDKIGLSIAGNKYLLSESSESILRKWAKAQII